MGLWLLKLLWLSGPMLAQEGILPCLESSPECLARLTEGAIAQSSEIEAIEQRLALMAQRLDQAQRRRWTNYLTLDPVELVQNLLGGGVVGRDKVTLAGLELQAADLVRRRQEVAEALGREVVERVLAYERLGRELGLLESQIETQRLQQAVLEATYRTGQGSTVQMLGVWQRTQELQGEMEERSVTQEQVRRELEALVRGLGTQANRGN
jgi:hypothetical protein